MTQRTITDAAGRAWTCTSAEGDGAEHLGRDVSISCVTESVDGPVNVIVGWQWEGMTENGLGRKISAAALPPKH